MRLIMSGGPGNQSYKPSLSPMLASLKSTLILAPECWMGGGCVCVGGGVISIHVQDSGTIHVAHTHTLQLHANTPQAFWFLAYPEADKDKDVIGATTWKYGLCLISRSASFTPQNKVTSYLLCCESHRIYTRTYEKLTASDNVLSNPWCSAAW